MTIKEFISGFNLLDKEKRPPVTSRWSTRLLLMHSEDVRSILLENKYKVENKPLDHEDMHFIPCIKLKKTSAIDCKTFKDLGCENIYMSESLLPDMIIREQLLVRSIDGSYKYDYVRWEDYTNILNSQYKAERDAPYFSLKTESGGIRLYILNDKIKTISIEGLFHSIIKPYLVMTCDSFDMTTDYREFRFPVAPALKHELYNQVFNKLLTIDQSAETDTKNNKSPDIANPMV